jgi:biopolymer transport protein ExbD
MMLAMVHARMSLALGLLLLGACTSTSTKPACDERLLEHAVASFEADPAADGAPQALIDSFAQACPSVHSGLVRELELTYVGGPPEAMISLLQDDAYRAERNQVCADLDSWARVPELAGDQRTRAVFEVCGLARFALLDSGEPWAVEDITGFIANDWLLRHGVEASLARRFARGLMLTTADESLSRQRCLAELDSPACATVVRAAANGLPVSTSGLPPGDATAVFVLPTSIWIRDRVVAPSSSLREALVEQAQRERARARENEREDEREWPGRLLLFADRETPMATLLEVMRAGHEAGYTEYALSVEHGDALATLAISPPLVWVVSSTETRGLLHPPYPKIVVEAHGVRLPATKETAAQTVAHGDVEQLEATARALATTDDHPPVIVRAEATIELQSVVATMDGLRGRECRLGRLVAGLDDNEPRECVLWEVIVDLDPPTARRPGRWSQLSLSLDEPKPEAWDSRKGPDTEPQLRARVESSLDGIRRCLLDSEDASAYMPWRFSYTFGTLEGDKLGARVFGPGSAWLPEACLVEAVGAGTIESGKRLLATAFVDVGVVIDVPP